MKIATTTLALLLSLPQLSSSLQITGGPSPLPSRTYVAFAFETVTVSTVAIGFTAATIQPAGEAYRAEKAEFSIETCSVRYQVGSNPTATVGVLLPSGNGAIYGWDAINRIRFIRDTSCGADAKLSAVYYR
jgi:hypothetical protein